MAKPNPTQPKIARKLATRSAILLLVTAVLVVGYRWAIEQRGDFDLAPANTEGMIAAIELRDEGQQLVVFTRDGKKVGNAGYQNGIEDRDAAWSPDGNRIFFVSNRSSVQNEERGAFNLFRWNPAANSEPSQRTTGTISRGNPAFSNLAEHQDLAPLLTGGGRVLTFNAKEMSTQLMLPPTTREVATSEQEGGGATTQFERLYSQIGSSFRTARWCGNGQYIAAVMRRDEGEILIVQQVFGTQLPLPKLAAAGESIDLSVDPKNGQVIYAVRGFQWPDPQMVPPQFRRNGKIVTPFRHALFVLDPTIEGPGQPIGVSPDDKNAFGPPAVSPNGGTLVIPIGEFADGVVNPKRLVSMPTTPNGAAAMALLVEGAVYEPSWHPTGELITYIKRLDGRRHIFTISREGRDEKQVSTGEGEYASPLFSPQGKAPPEAK